MDDTRLLELASKAAGENYGHDNNPLKDDALALRLAVKLEMNVDVGIYGVEAAIIDDDQRISAEEALRQDPYAATRRAIVRAAAVIGKQMA